MFALTRAILPHNYHRSSIIIRHCNVAVQPESPKIHQNTANNSAEAKPTGNENTIKLNADNTKTTTSNYLPFNDMKNMTVASMSGTRFERLKVKTAAATIKSQEMFYDRFFRYIKYWNKKLQTKSVQIIRVFSIGMKDFYREIVVFIKARKKAKSHEQLRALSREEIELWYQIPKDIVTVAPLFIVSAAPFANYVLFPLAYIRPKYFLSSHFWSRQQRAQFWSDFLTKRLHYNLTVFRFLQANVVDIKNVEPDVMDKWQVVVEKLHMGKQPSLTEIIESRDVFEHEPYHLNLLPNLHLKRLCGLHGIHRGFRRRYRLADRAFMIHHMDLAIQREGGLDSMTKNQYEYALYLRGLHTNGLNEQQKKEWLREWIEVSALVDYKNISLLLHLPILLGFNHFSNWKLLMK